MARLSGAMMPEPGADVMPRMRRRRSGRTFGRPPGDRDARR